VRGLSTPMRPPPEPEAGAPIPATAATVNASVDVNGNAAPTAGNGSHVTFAPGVGGTPAPTPTNRVSYTQNAPSTGGGKRRVSTESLLSRARQMSPATSSTRVFVKPSFLERTGILLV